MIERNPNVRTEEWQQNIWNFVDVMGMKKEEPEIWNMDGELPEGMVEGDWFHQEYFLQIDEKNQIAVFFEHPLEDESPVWQMSIVHFGDPETDIGGMVTTFTKNWQDELYEFMMGVLWELNPDLAEIIGNLVEVGREDEDYRKMVMNILTKKEEVDYSKENLPN